MMLRAFTPSLVLWGVLAAMSAARPSRRPHVDITMPRGAVDARDAAALSELRDVAAEMAAWAAGVAS